MGAKSDRLGVDMALREQTRSMDHVYSVQAIGTPFPLV